MANRSVTSTWRFAADKFLKAKRINFRPPMEIATYSTMVKPAGQEATEHVPENPDLQRFTVQELYQRTLCDDDRRNCKTLDAKSQHLPFNLNVGYDTVIEKKDDNEFLSLLLERLSRDNLVGQSEFVCFRSLLTKLGCTPYDVSNKWLDRGMTVVVQKITGVYYMFEFPTTEDKAWAARRTDRDKQMAYWGTKFPSYLTIQPGQSVPTPSDYPLDQNLEFCSVVETKIGSHSVILRGEIDCCDAGGDYIEFKTNREFQREHHAQDLHRNKLIKWWLQTSLVGAKEVWCGFRNEFGSVGKLRTYRVTDLPEKMAMEGRKPAASLAFIDKFLDIVKEHVTEELIPHVFQREALSSSFEISLDKDGAYKFVPSWFAEHVRS